ncbi:MAG: hypothetical protein QOI12_1827 [Alphaproteobacteria bacterium]|jgi:hypothetical protein|nr:hypothetical protein [Alphaproteobacteria bacterium]
MSKSGMSKSGISKSGIRKSQKRDGYRAGSFGFTFGPKSVPR